MTATADVATEDYHQLGAALHGNLPTGHSSMHMYPIDGAASDAAPAQLSG